MSDDPFAKSDRTDRAYRLTVGELIDELSGFPPDMLVVCAGYEGGHEPPIRPHVIRLVLDRNDARCYGPHEQVEPGEPEFDTAVEAVTIR